MKKEYISEAVIRRLPRYYRYLYELHRQGIDRISSTSLGAKMGITASQIRQDLSCFGEFGQQGYGYRVEALRKEIGSILGVDRTHRLIIIGNGNLAHALIRNFGFKNAGFQLVGAFDVNPTLIGGEMNGIMTYSMTDLEAFLSENMIDVAVLTVPAYAAQETAERLVSAGIHGIWNFTNVELHLDNSDVKIENVHFADSLLTLSYRISTNE